MSYVLGYPLTRGNSQEIKPYQRAADVVLSAGTIACQDADGNIIAFDATKPILGVVGRSFKFGTTDILRRGIEVVMQIAGAPNGGICYAGTDGKASATGDIAIGTFVNSEVFVATNGDTGLDVENCALVNVDVSNNQGLSAEMDKIKKNKGGN